MNARRLLLSAVLVAAGSAFLGSSANAAYRLILCDTAEQIEQVFTLHSEETTFDEAIEAVNKQAGRPNACSKVVRVDEAGPAAAAGLKFGDVILSLDDQPIRSGKELTDAVRSKQPSSTVRLRVRREDGDRELNLVLGKRPKS